MVQCVRGGLLPYFRVFVQSYFIRRVLFFGSLRFQLFQMGGDGLVERCEAFPVFHSHFPADVFKAGIE